jgi:hypothetical protein
MVMDISPRYLHHGKATKEHEVQQSLPTTAGNLKEKIQIRKKDSKCL